MDTITIFGVIGASIILLAFSMNQLGKWPSDSKSYDWSNLIGSLILTVFAVLTNSIPFVVLNSVWFLVSLRDLIKSR